MLQESSGNKWHKFLPVLIGLTIVAGIVGLPAGRNLIGRFFQSLRMQKVQAVNVNFSAFTDPNANPSLHQMIAQMVSDDVNVTANESDQTAADAAEAARLSGFDVAVVSARKDPAAFVVTGRHAFDMTLDRDRLQSVFNQSGHPEISVPPALNGAGVKVDIPKAVEIQYGHCPGPRTAGQELASNVTGPTPTSAEYSDCLRLREGPNPIVNAPQGMDIQKLAEIGLETAGMNPNQARDFLQTVNWQSTLVMSVPRFLRAYEVVTISGVKGTLLNMAARRGPGYAVLWAKGGRGYLLTGFGDPGHAVELADSVK
jgi:hypothetical protein